MDQSISVLIVGISHTFAMYLALLMRRMGFKTLIANSLESVEGLLSREKVDILLLENSKDGHPALRMINSLRKVFPSSDLPFIVLANRDESVARDALLEAGCRGYLLKPLQPRHLHEALQSNLKLPSGQRKYLRGSVDLMVEVSIWGLIPNKYHLLSLSRKGALISHPEAVPTGTPVSLILSIEDELIPLMGTVIYNRKDFSERFKYAFAILFHCQSLVHEEKIEHYLEKMLEKECYQAAKVMELKDFGAIALA